MYFWGAEISIPRALLRITRAPEMELALASKRAMMQTPEYLSFQDGATVSLAEVYEVNALSRVANLIGHKEQEYMTPLLADVMAGTTQSEGI